MGGSLKFKDIEVPVFLIFHRLCYPWGNVIEGDWRDQTASDLVSFCWGMYLQITVNNPDIQFYSMYMFSVVKPGNYHFYKAQ